VRTDEARASRRQLLIGLLVIPLSLLPFAAYAALTPEGRLLKDKAELALAPPELGSLDGALQAQVEDAIPMYRNAVMPLVYHGVGSTSSAEGKYVVSPDRFAEHLASLRAAGVHFVTPERVAEAFRGGRALPSRAVLLTFDDGRTDAMMWATPLLEQAHAVATMFVITAAAEDKAVYYADWGALERYDRGPWNLQSHTDALHTEQDVGGGRSLPALTSTAPGESLAQYRDRVRADLERADHELLAHTGQRPVAFAYPFGAYGAERTNDPAIRGILRDEVQRRYQLAFHQDEQATVPLATAESDRLSLRRLSVGDWSGPTLVRRIAAAARRTPLPGDELQVAPPTFADVAPEAPLGDVPSVDQLVPTLTRARVPSPPEPVSGPTIVAAPAAPALVGRLTPASPVSSPSSPSHPSPSPQQSKPASSPTSSPPKSSAPPPASSDPSPGQSGDPHGNGGGNGRANAPGQQKK
jgi:peptidoglycan/xylan/chitin deacetylase (PgdA/CDA1 family)